VDIRIELLKEHSKKQSIKIANYIDDDAKLFETLIKLVMDDDTVVAQRAAWVMSFCSKKNPAIVLPHLSKLIKHLYNENLHDAVKRNTIRVMQTIKIPKNVQGAAVDICFKFVTSNNEATAIKAFAITVLANICKEESELKNELLLVVKQQMLHGSAAIISRGNRTLRLLEAL
jgi:uncharacterized protein (UPF0147 family)